MSDRDTWNMFAAAVAQGMVASTAHVNANGPSTFTPSELSRLSGQYADALLAESKKRETPAPTPPQPDDDGWIKWEGGECPVTPLTVVQVQLRDGIKLLDHAENLSWAHFPGAGDVVSFRIVSEAGVTK